MATKHQSIEERYGSFPVPLEHQIWGPWLAAAVCATAAIATWSLVVGGYTAYYVGAREGTATLLAGGLLAQLMVTMSQVPPNTKHGIETVVTTKPQLGVRGSYIALAIQFFILTGWNLVLMIFFGRSVAALMKSIGVISESQSGSVSLVASVCAALVVWAILTKGSRALRYIAPVIAVIVVCIAIWMLTMLLGEYSIDTIASSPPLDPLPGGSLTNYTVALELMMASTIGWWAYMGGMMRMVNSAHKAALPSMMSLGFGWAAVALISLYAALVTGEWDPTVWMLELGGARAGLVVLLFIALANIGSTLVGVHSAALGLGQVPFLAARVRRWGAMTGIVIVPMIAILVFFPDPFYDNISSFLAFVGIMIAPLIGIQIVDWFVFHRNQTLHISSLYRHHPVSRYWYDGGYNFNGILGLAAGGVVYIALLDPVAFVPRSSMFEYTTATVPAAAVGGATYWVLSTLRNTLTPSHNSPSQDSS
ncbi:MAG: cytosine permease [Halofilum sp. (in: g-proteobacteria)]